MHSFKVNGKKKHQLPETMSWLLWIIDRPRHQSFSYGGYFFSEEDASVKTEGLWINGDLFLSGKAHCRAFQMSLSNALSFPNNITVTLIVFLWHQGAKKNRHSCSKISKAAFLQSYSSKCGRGKICCKEMVPS